MKKKIIIVLMFLTTIFCFSCSLNFEKENYEDIKYKYIRYANYDDGSDICMEFGDDHYSVYDCDSEPTGYGFDSEHECKVHYDNKKNTLKFFNCKYGNRETDTLYIKKWSFTMLIFEYKGKTRYLRNVNSYEFVDYEFGNYKYGGMGMSFNSDKTVSFYLRNQNMDTLETCNYTLNEETNTLSLDCSKIFEKGTIEILDYGKDYLNAIYDNKKIHFRTR